MSYEIISNDRDREKERKKKNVSTALYSSERCIRYNQTLKQEF